MTTVDIEVPDEKTLGDIETTEDKLGVLAMAYDESPAEVRARYWRMIANSDGTEQWDGEELYEEMVDIAYDETLNLVSEQLDIPLGPELGGSEATAKASGPDSDPLELFGTGLQGGSELTERQIEAARERAESDEDADEIVGEYGTGLQGDASREEYLEREKEISRLSEAFKRAKSTEDES